MNPRRLLKSLLAHLGFRVLREARLPRGLEPFRDLRDLVGASRLRTVVDVGANVGQTVSALLRDLPNVERVVAVEPTPDAFAELQRRFHGDTRVCAVRCALSSQAGSGTLVRVSPRSQLNHILRAGEATDAASEPVELRTLSSLASELGLSGVDLLKIDAEGHDFDVIKGAMPLLETGRVGAVLVEICFDAIDHSHAHFDEIHGALTELGFSCLGFYDVHHAHLKMHYGNALYLCSRYFDPGTDGRAQDWRDAQ